MATTKWLRLQIISSTPCLKKQKQTQKSSILADDATLLFHLETDMTDVCVCVCVCAVFKAKIRRKGQVREYSVKLQANEYRGEVTGINKNKTRSTKFKHD